MKATIEVPDELYRRVKSKSALEGRAVREVAVQLFRDWVDEPPVHAASEAGAAAGKARPSWFGSLRRYAGNARGRHDMDAIRDSIARGRAGKRSKGRET